MIKVNELRIGNYVEWNRGIFKCCQIFNNSVENELWCKPLNELHPIQLTEEWFLKLGLEKCFSNDYWYSIKFGDKRLLVSILGNVEIKKWDGTMIGFLSICEYVHQLQNLYFALCGEELVFSSTEP